jgi:hypothetical protein
LFNHLLHEFRNSKVNMATPNYMSGVNGLHQVSMNLSSGTPSTIKHSKKKSASIDKKTNTSTITTGGGSDMAKKQVLKKGMLTYSIRLFKDNLILYRRQWNS